MIPKVEMANGLEELQHTIDGSNSPTDSMKCSICNKVFYTDCEFNKHWNDHVFSYHDSMYNHN